MESYQRRVPRPSRTLHVEILNDELCIYDWTTQRVHALNATAARIWPLCDGTRTIAQIVGVLRESFGDNALALVSLALAEFTAAGLLETGGSLPETGVSRRGLMRRLGLTAAMLPVVTSILAPSKILAASLLSMTFNFTGGPQSFDVPTGVTNVTVDAYGAGGGAGATVATTSASGGMGGRVQAVVAVTPGESLIVNVGGAGQPWKFPSGGGAGGFNGGGNGHVVSGGGGGASDVRRGSTKLVVAGGGGGGGQDRTAGSGGGTVGADGAPPPYEGSAGSGSGGSQVAGGAGGSAGQFGAAGMSGAAGTGGNGSSAYLYEGGGGGGGYFGGGGGASMYQIPGSGGGGGGGSSYTDPAASNVTHSQGVQSGNGKVTISW